MAVTILTRMAAVTALLLIGLLAALRLVAVINPRERWTIENVYGGSPDATDPTAYFNPHRVTLGQCVAFEACCDSP